jgi:hypothetical protein
LKTILIFDFICGKTVEGGQGCLGSASGGAKLKNVRLLVLGAAAWCGGTAFRFWYVLRGHHPRHHVTSDVWDLVQIAERLLGGSTQTRHDTVWPPGPSVSMAAALTVDPSLGSLAWAQALASAAVPLLICHMAWLVAGRRAAGVALLLASLDFSLVHYAGFFLAEFWFTFWITVALWSSIVALRIVGGSSGSRIGRIGRIGAGACVGLTWATACLFRPNALPVALLAGAGLATFSLAKRDSQTRWLLLGGVLALSLALAPTTHRCTVLTGAPCPGSANFAMNIALGQAPFAELKFQSPGTAVDSTSWRPPSLPRHGYEGIGHVPGTIWETSKILRWLAKQFWSHPFSSLGRALGNGLDLFGLYTWPDKYGLLAPRAAYIAKQLFFAAAILPGLLGYWRILKRARSENLRDVEVVLTSVLTAVFLVAAFSMGESRYRVPFDGVLIALAASVWAGSSARHAPERPPSKLGLWLAGCAALACTVVITGFSHPGLAWGRSCRQAEALPYGAQLATAAVPGVPLGDAQIVNHTFRCAPGCEALRVELAGAPAPRTVELTFGEEGNRYQVSARLAGKAVGVAFVYSTASRPVRVGIAGNPKIDGWTIQPLYGDGNYYLQSISTREPASGPHDQ